jgi:hypothetical protein
MYAHFKAISEATDLPIILYNVPGRTGVNMLPDTALRLATDCKNIVGIKEASGNIEQIEYILRHRPEGFKVFSGDDGITLPLIKSGADGVISVIGGWFITAGAAFIMACCIAALNHFGGGIAMLGIIGIVVLVLVNNNRKFKKKQASENVDTLFREIVSSQDKQETWQLLKKHVSQTQTSIIATARESFVNITSGLVDENIRNLRAASIDIEEQRAMLKRYRKKEILGMRKIDHLLAVEKNTWFHLGTNSGMQILYGLKRMLEPCIEHVDNNFNPLPQAYVDSFKPISEQTVALLQTVETMISSCSFENTEKVLAEAEDMKTAISDMRHNLENHIQKEECDLKISLLYLSTLQVTQELVSNVRHLLRASKRFQE